MPCVGFNIPALKYCPAAQLLFKVKEIQLNKKNPIKNNFFTYLKNIHNEWMKLRPIPLRNGETNI